MSQQPEPSQLSDLYEYTLHDEIDNTLQVFFTHTMSSSYFSAKQTLDLLNFLTIHRAQIESLALAQAERRHLHKNPQKENFQALHPQAKQDIEEPKTITRCDYCHKEVDQLYDLTPTPRSESSTVHVCKDCYDRVIHERLKQQGPPQQ